MVLLNRTLGLFKPQVFMWLLLILCCFKVFELRRPLVIHNFSIGHADSAAYALQGRSLAEKGTLDIRYITNFYHPYDKKIERHDDHWPPFQGMFYAPAFYVFGSDASIARQCNLFMGAVILPLVSAWFLYALTGKYWLSGAIAFLVLSDKFVFKASAGLLADVSHCALLVAFAAAMVSSRRFHPMFLVLAGVLGGLAWTCKGSQILLLPFMVFGTLVLFGPRMLLKKPFLLGVLAFVLILSPRAYRNVSEGRTPFHSTQNYVASFFGLEKHPWGNWDQNFYGVYWGESLPEAHERFSDIEKYKRALLGNIRVALGTVMLGTDGVNRNHFRLTEWEKMGEIGRSMGLSLTEEPYQSQLEATLNTQEKLPLINPVGEWSEGWVSLIHILGFSLSLGSFMVLPFVWITRKLRGKSEGKVWERALFILGGLILMHISFPVIFWYVMPRLVMTVEPIFSSVGIAAVLWLCLITLWALRRGWIFVSKRLPSLPGLERFVAQLQVIKKIRGVWIGIFWLILGGVIHGKIDDWHGAQVKENPMRVFSRPHYPHYYRVAESMKGIVPDDAIVMTRNPWELLFYAPETMRATGLPYAEPRVILGVAKYYGVTYMLNDRQRPGLKSFLNSGHPGITRVISRPSPVYKIDFSLFSPEEIATEDELKGYNREFLKK